MPVYLFPSWALSNLEALGSSQEMAHHGNKLLHFLKRVEIKQLIANLKKVNPFVEANIFKSVENVNLATVVAYKKDGIKHSFLEHYDE